MAKRKFDLASVIDLPVSHRDTEQLVMVPLDNLYGNARNFYTVDDTDLKALADSIQLHGLVEPIAVLEVDGEPGKYRIISGHRRKAASRLAGLEEVPCRVMHPENQVYEEIMLISANATARKLTSYEIGRQANRMTELLIELRNQGKVLPGRMRQMVADAMNVSASKLARIHAIEEHLITEFLPAWQNGEIAERTAYDISRLPEGEQMEFFGFLNGGKATVTSFTLWQTSRMTPEEEEDFVTQFDTEEEEEPEEPENVSQWDTAEEPEEQPENVSQRDTEEVPEANIVVESEKQAYYKERIRVGVDVLSYFCSKIDDCEGCLLQPVCGNYFEKSLFYTLKDSGILCETNTSNSGS